MTNRTIIFGGLRCGRTYISLITAPLNSRYVYDGNGIESIKKFAKDLGRDDIEVITPAEMVLIMNSRNKK